MGNISSNNIGTDSLELRSPKKRKIGNLTNAEELKDVRDLKKKFKISQKSDSGLHELTQHAAARSPYEYIKMLSGNFAAVKVIVDSMDIEACIELLESGELQSSTSAIIRNRVLAETLSYLKENMQNQQHFEICFVHHKFKKIINILAKSPHNDAGTFREVVYHTEQDNVREDQTYHDMIPGTDGKYWRPIPLDKFEIHVQHLVNAGYVLDKCCEISKKPNFYGKQIL